MGACCSTSRRVTHPKRARPSAEEVAPWVEAILRLWDDEAFYRQQSEKAIARAAQWCPERLRPLYVEFFRNVYPQPGPPVRARAHPDVGRIANPSYDGPPPAGGMTMSVGQVANLPGMRQIGNLPHISVITPVYNGMKTLERAVRSVLAQTFRNWELLLVDDCSTDDSRKIARALAAEDRRIRLIEKEENTGIGATRNVGLPPHEAG